jgi:hypothetical protein
VIGSQPPAHLDCGSERRRERDGAKPHEADELRGVEPLDRPQAEAAFTPAVLDPVHEGIALRA